MLEKIKLHMRLFLQSKILLIVYLLICAIPIYLTLGYLGYNDIVSIFYSIINKIFYVSLLFGMIMYTFLQLPESSKTSEALECIHQSKSYKAYYIIIILILAFIYNIIILLSLFIAAIYLNQINLMFSLLIQYYFMNILLPQMCFLMIVYLLTRVKNMKIVLPVFILVIFLSSPFINLFSSMTKPESMIIIDNIIQFMIKPFSYFYQFGLYIYDELYGFQNEIYKIYILLFWVGLTLFIIFKNRISKKLWIIPGCILCLIFTGINIPQSVHRVDDSWRNTYNDKNYYRVKEGESSYRKEEKLDYYISDYDLDIKIRRQLDIKGSIKLVSDIEKTDYVLTLYHGYNLKKLTGSKKLKYEQKKDYIYIHLSEPTKEVQLNISYSGYHPTMYSNHQAVQLPGYFPWYPMEGEKQIYIRIQDPSTGWEGYNPYNRVKNANFNVDVDVLYPFVTNLKHENGSHYSGKSDSFTLIGGNMITTDNRQIKNYMPLVLINNSSDKFLGMIDDNNAELIHQLNDWFKLDCDGLKKKPIIVCSRGLTQVTNIGGYCEFNDYILMNDSGFVNPQVYLTYYLLQNNTIDPVLRDMITLFAIVGPQSQDEFISEIQQYLDDYAKSYKSYTGEDPNLNVRIKKVLEFKENFENDIDRLGVEGYMKKISDEMEVE
jgi:hypothetical protein